MKSTKTFREAVALLLEMEDLSIRQMVKRGERHADEPRTMGAVQPVLAGRTEPSIGLIEYVAQALRVDPETFAEYRMWLARRLFDPSEIGFDAALKNLQALEQHGAEADLPLPAGEIAARIGRRGRPPGKAESA